MHGSDDNIHLEFSSVTGPLNQVVGVPYVESGRTDVRPLRNDTVADCECMKKSGDGTMNCACGSAKVMRVFICCWGLC